MRFLSSSSENGYMLEKYGTAVWENFDHLSRVLSLATLSSMPSGQEMGEEAAGGIPCNLL